jgi:hypothetical protein
VHIGIYAERLRGGPLPWDEEAPSVRASRALPEIRRGARGSAICQNALAFDVVSVPRIAAMLKSAAEPVSPADTQSKVVQLTLPRLARPAAHFETLATTLVEAQIDRKSAESVGFEPTVPSRVHLISKRALPSTILERSRKQARSAIRVDPKTGVFTRAWGNRGAINRMRAHPRTPSSWRSRKHWPRHPPPAGSTSLPNWPRSLRHGG